MDTVKYSLDRYAERRLMLAGGAFLSEHNPYCVSIDELERANLALGRQLLSFGHYDYLGAGAEQSVRTAAAKAAMTFGVGVGASRLVGGERSLHRDIETSLARFVGTDDCLAMVSGYGANVALIGHMLTTGDLIVADEYAHNSIVSGTRLSRAKTMMFGHNDMHELANLLKSERHNFRRVLVVIEGLYSMDGDLPDLPRVVELCETHRAWLMIDEAHSIGLLGARGRGISEHYGIDPRRIDLIVGTLSKSFAACGGFICASEAVIGWLRYTLPGYVYSVGIPPPTAAAVAASLRLLEREPERLRAVAGISDYFLTQARKANFDVGGAAGIGIVPIIFEDMDGAMLASTALLNAGIYVPPIVQSPVPKDLPRLRFFLTARHTRADVDRALKVLVEWRGHPGRTAPDRAADAHADQGVTFLARDAEAGRV